MKLFYEGKLVKEMRVGEVLLGCRIDEVRFDKHDFARIFSDSRIERDNIREWMRTSLHCRFAP